MLSNDFKLNVQTREVDNPFFICNIQTWDEKRLLSVDDKWLKLLEKKKTIINKEFPVETATIYILDGEYTIQYIPADYLVKDLNIAPEYREKLTPEEVRNKLMEYIDKGLLTDQQYQIIFSILTYFDISEIGLLYPKEDLQKGKITLTDNTEEERYNVYKSLLQLPFSQFYKQTLNFVKDNNLDLNKVKEELDNYVIRKQIDAGYINDKLPNKYIPLVARNAMTGPDGKQFQPSLWQMYFMYHEVDKKMNFVVALRQGGKSVQAAFFSLILLLSQGRGDILYVLPSEEFMVQPLQYFERFAKKFKKYNLIKIKKADKIVECPITGNTLKFVSSLSKAGGRSQSSPYIIFDEASYIKDEVFERVLPIFLGKGGKFYAFSTINWEQRRDNTEWFFKWSRWIELGKKYDLGGGEVLDLSDIGNVLRVSIDEVEWKDKKEVQLLKLSLKDKPEKYFAELYATLPTSDKLFTTEGFWLVPELYYKKYHSVNNKYIIGYDPAKLQDIGGIVVLDATSGVIIEEIALKKVNYLDQIEIIKKLIAQYNNAQLVFDRTRDEATYELLIKEGIRPISIKYTSGGEVRRDRQDWWLYYVPKKVLVDTFEMMVEQGKLSALGNLALLQEEINNFKAKKTRAGNIKYEADIGTDDVLNAAFVATFYYYKQLENELFLKEAQKTASDVLKEKLLQENYTNPYTERYNKFIY